MIAINNIEQFHVLMCSGNFFANSNWFVVSGADTEEIIEFDELATDLKFTVSGASIST